MISDASVLLIPAALGTAYDLFTPDAVDAKLAFFLRARCRQRLSELTDVCLPLRRYVQWTRPIFYSRAVSSGSGDRMGDDCHRDAVKRIDRFLYLM